MAKNKSKGTALQLEIATVFTTIAGVTSLDGPDPEVKTFDATSLDGGVGEEVEPTGYVKGGNVSGKLFFDPVAATLQALTDLLLAPAVVNWKILWSDAATTAWPFAGILKKVKPAAEISNGLLADFEIELDGLVAYPT